MPNTKYKFRAYYPRTGLGEVIYTTGPGPVLILEECVGLKNFIPPTVSLKCENSSLNLEATLGRDE